MNKQKDIPTLTDRQLKSFWSRVVMDYPSKNACWIWSGWANKYGVFRIKNGLHSTHRISYFISRGENPKDKLILHSCDNPLCVNPNHLRAGTSKDNISDMFERKRDNSPYKKGHTMNVGRKHSEETKIKRSEAIKLSWVERKKKKLFNESKFTV